MATQEHPSSADLLLWQSGELSSERTEEVRLHLQGCEECQHEIAELESIYDGVATVDDRTAQYRVRDALEERHLHFWKRLQFRPRWTAATASIVIAALLLVTFTEYTPSARAEALLSRAVKEEVTGQEHAHLLKIQSSGVNCNVVVRHAVAVVSASNSDQSLCGRLTTNLHNAGWNWNDLLSARSFKQWREGLKEKKDAVRKLSDATEVTTTTIHGPLRRATLRVRSIDYQAVQARFVFASGAEEEQPEFEVTESEDVPQEISKSDPAPAPVMPEPKTLPPPLPVIDPMDATEADVRLALHRLGADKSVLLAVNRGPDTIHVTGVVPDKAQADSIIGSLSSLSHVETHVAAEGEGGLSSSWRSFQGDAPPLAYDKLNTLYSESPQARQRFINHVDDITQRLLAEARTRDSLLVLANRLLSQSEAEQLKLTLADTESSMAADLGSLAFALQPVLEPASNPLTPGARGLTSVQAIRLYDLVHELVFMNRANNRLSLEDTQAQVCRLISGK